MVFLRKDVYTVADAGLLVSIYKASVDLGRTGLVKFAVAKGSKQPDMIVIPEPPSVSDCVCLSVSLFLSALSPAFSHVSLCRCHPPTLPLSHSLLSHSLTHSLSLSLSNLSLSNKMYVNVRAITVSGRVDKEERVREKQ